MPVSIPGLGDGRGPPPGKSTIHWSGNESVVTSSMLLPGPVCMKGIGNVLDSRKIVLCERNFRILLEVESHLSCDQSCPDHRFGKRFDLSRVLFWLCTPLAGALLGGVREAVGRDTTHPIKQPRLKRSPSHTQTIDRPAEPASADGWKW